MALNLTREADQLITAYMKREALPSKASAVNRLIVLTLGAVPQPTQTPAQPQVIPQPQAMPAMPAMPSFGSQFKL